MFNARMYANLSKDVFQSDYPGYKPNVVESPNGDGAIDAQKKYAHVAYKYTKSAVLRSYLWEGHYMATEAAVELGIPKKYWPAIEYSVLRVLEYDYPATSHSHTDLSLFTLNLYRSDNDNFCYGEIEDTVEWVPGGAKFGPIGGAYGHCGELAEIINPVAYKAAPHYVTADRYKRSQFSLVYFAVPDHDAVLPIGVTVGDWIAERLARSRSIY